jgi:cystathionine beta-lyase
MDFDKVIDRSGTRANKLEYRKLLFKTEDVIPLWVADMDLAISEEIQNDLKKRLEHPVFGYTYQDSDFLEAIVNWQKKRNNWEISARSVTAISGVLPAIAMSIKAFTEVGDKIMIQTPVYPPFFDLVQKSERVLIKNPLIEKEGNYFIDFADMEKSFAEGVKMIIIANPHNPVGKVFTKDELVQLTDLCVKYNVMILSDEIHSDLIMGEKPHIPVASISKEASALTITCMSPTKSFNIAGLSVAYTIIENRDLRKAYRYSVNSMHLNMVNTLGTEALISAYTKGEPWLEELVPYIKSNIEFVSEFLKNKVPQVSTSKNEGTYLVWLDFRKLKMTNSELKSFLIEKAKLGLNQGIDFGEEGSGFARLNAATSRVILEKAMNQLKEAVDNLG